MLNYRYFAFLSFYAVTIQRLDKSDLIKFCTRNDFDELTCAHHFMEGKLRNSLAIRMLKVVSYTLLKGEPCRNEENAFLNVQESIGLTN